MICVLYGAPLNLSRRKVIKKKFKIELSAPPRVHSGPFSAFYSMVIVCRKGSLEPAGREPEMSEADCCIPSESGFLIYIILRDPSTNLQLVQETEKADKSGVFLHTT